MGLFNKSGGILNVIRCDESEYLVWKWRPQGEANSTKRENAIRYGSSLRVKDGEVAVFVYNQKDGTCQDFIMGPHDKTIETGNFPVLASIVGAAFGGNSPFQAEIYFINLEGNIQIPFAVPFFDVFDPRFLDFGVPVAVRGTITFNIKDAKEFIKLNRLIDFTLEAFKTQTKDAIIKYVKGVVANLPQDKGIPVIQLERKILEVNDAVQAYLAPRMENDFGVHLKALDLANIDVDKTSDGFRQLKRVTADIASQTTIAQADINIQNMQDTQAMNAENLAETMRIQREEMQRAQKLQTESGNMQAHALNIQGDVLKTGAQSLGEMGTMNMGGSGDGGMNPAGMMTGMAMGGAMGGQMTQMMNQMGQNMQAGGQSPNAQMPPPPPQIQYSVHINGQTQGPFGMQQLQQMAQSGQLTAQTNVWKVGMTNWEVAGNVQELSGLFMAQTPPPPPPMA